MANGISTLNGSDPPRAEFQWNRLELTEPLDLDATLRSGQAFRWRQDGDGIWWGVLGRQVAALWRPAGARPSDLYWQTFPVRDSFDTISDAFRLELAIEPLYRQWIAAEPRIERALAAFRGLRIMRQEPQECLYSFLCATCNTVVKIERAVWALATRYGPPIQTGISSQPFAFHEFPSNEALAGADEQTLRSDLWGYRAPLVPRVARLLRSRPESWLSSLRSAPYEESWRALAELPGIGRKVADCICLFALDKDAAVPVDTHVRQIAYRLNCPEYAEKSLTPRVYEAISQSYRLKFGDYAGWAQQYLFFAELARSRLQTHNLV